VGEQGLFACFGRAVASAARKCALLCETTANCPVAMAPNDAVFMSGGHEQTQLRSAKLSARLHKHNVIYRPRYSEL
jgi:hypothetical protein